MAGGRCKKNNNSPSCSTSTSTSSVKKSKRERPKSELLPIENLPSLISLVASATSAAHTFVSQNDLQLHPSQTLTLESKVTSTALSLTKLNSILSKTTQTPPPPLSLSLSSTSSPSHSSPSPCWFERFLSAASSNSDPRWVETFRMSKPSFARLLQTLIPHLQKSDSSTPPDHMLGVALFQLAHATSFNSVGRRFGMDSATACHVFYEVCKAIINQLGDLFDFPSNLDKIIVGFGWISLPNCCGALGYSRFLAESQDPEKKEKKDASLIVQSLVDSEGRFLDISVGWAVSMIPSSILPRTHLFSRIEVSKELLHGPSYQFHDGTSIPQYIIGNSSCPMLPWLLTPYPTSSKNDHCNFSEEAFNAVHTRGMKLVSTAFRRLRTRWRLFATKWTKDAMSYSFVIVAGCLLHNFLLKHSEPFPEDDVDSSEDVLEVFPVLEGNKNQFGEHVRDGLAFQLGQVRQM